MKNLLGAQSCPVCPVGTENKGLIPDTVNRASIINHTDWIHHLPVHGSSTPVNATLDPVKVTPRAKEGVAWGSRTPVIAKGCMLLIR